MSGFKAGQTVWDILRGRGYVDKVTSEQVYVTFAGWGRIAYTLNGQIGKGFNRSLYFSEPKVDGATSPPFVPKLKKGDSVIISMGQSGGTVCGVVEFEDANVIKLEEYCARGKGLIISVHKMGDKVY